MLLVPVKGCDVTETEPQVQTWEALNVLNINVKKVLSGLQAPILLSEPLRCFDPKLLDVGSGRFS